MTHRHDWKWKTTGIQSRFWVVCAECGKDGGVYDTEEKADKRILQLRHGEIRGPIARYPVAGLASRARRARAERRRRVRL